MQRLDIPIEDEIKQKLKIWAFQKNMPLHKMVSDILLQYIEFYENQNADRGNRNIQADSSDLQSEDYIG